MLPRSSKKHVSWKHRVPEDKRKSKRKPKIQLSRIRNHGRKTEDNRKCKRKHTEAACRMQVPEEKRKKNGGVNGSKHVFQKWVTHHLFESVSECRERIAHSRLNCSGAACIHINSSNCYSISILTSPSLLNAETSNQQMDFRFQGILKFDSFWALFELKMIPESKRKKNGR